MCVGDHYLKAVGERIRAERPYDTKVVGAIPIVFDMDTQRDAVIIVDKRVFALRFVAETEATLELRIERRE